MALAALYEVGTCNRKCWGGPHLLESLSVRVYNLGVSAYLLMVRASMMKRGLGHAGGVVQEEGLKFTLDEVMGKVGAVTLMATAFAQLHDYVTALSEKLEDLKVDKH
jgi:hypothetical protein